MFKLVFYYSNVAIKNMFLKDYIYYTEKNSIIS